jgi:hypothetical protein
MEMIHRILYLTYLDLMLSLVSIGCLYLSGIWQDSWWRTNVKYICFYANMGSEVVALPFPTVLASKVTESPKKISDMYKDPPPYCFFLDWREKITHVTKTRWDKCAKAGVLQCKKMGMMEESRERQCPWSQGSDMAFFGGGGGAYHHGHGHTCTHYKDLGVLFDKKLTNHCQLSCQLGDPNSVT